MQTLKARIDPSRHGSRKTYAIGGMLLVCGLAGCGSTKTATVTASQTSPQTYFAPLVAGTGNGQVESSTGAVTVVPIYTPQIYVLDDVAGAFSQSTFQLALPQQGPQVLNTGTLSIGQRGLRSLGITANYVSDNIDSPHSYVPLIPSNSPEPGSFAVELAGQAGGLAQLVGQPAVPLVAATQCPSLTTAQTYQFITLPGALVAPASAGSQGGWDPTTETAYGSVDVTAKGSTVTFQNIHRFTLPSVGGSGAPAQPGASQATGTCAPTVFGETTNVPAQLVVSQPGLGQAPAQATIAIGASNGLLLEDNGSGRGNQPDTSPSLPYNNVLGAGTGAVGLPRPASALDTGALVGAQYLGFIDAIGVFVSSQALPTSSSYHLGSFGFSTVPSSCAAVTAGTGTLIYGGDFTGDNPSASPDGFSNCDFAIDFGAQDASNNGLYPSATVWVGAGYAGNTTHATYSFPAVAVAGQIGGKFAIFVLGVDSTQPWAIYLLQSN
jgi:hypothetical protein